MSRPTDRTLSSILLTTVLAFTLVFTGCKEDESAAQNVPGMTDTAVVAEAASARAQRILENLKFEIPQLRELPVIMGDIYDGTVSGLDRGSFMVQGQSYHFVVTEDDTQLFMLAAPAIDASRSADAIASAYAEEAAAVAREAAERSAQLAQAAASLPGKGPADAPVTIVEFSDFQCPYCKRAAPTIMQVLDQYPADVRLAYAHYPLPNHPWARPAAIASECAAAQNPDLFWLLHDRYFDNQQQINPGNVLALTRSYLSGSGIDLDAWNTCSTDTESDGYKAATARIEEQMALGRTLGFSGTPAFFVNGTIVAGAKPLEEFTAAVEAALGR